MDNGWRKNKYGGLFNINNTNTNNVNANQYMNDKIRKESEKEQISVSRAKQRFKENIYKYGLGSSFEDSILYYNLQKNEIKSLYEYAKKTKEYQQTPYSIDNIYEIYKDGII